MSEGASRSDTTGSDDEARATDEAQWNGARATGGGSDGMQIEIGGDQGGYVRISAGRTVAALVAVVGAVAIVAILAYPRLLRVLEGSAERGGDTETGDGERESDRADGERSDESGEPSRRRSVSDGSGR